MVSQSPRWVIVSDFDGTITEEDLVISVTTHFCEENVGVVDAVQSGKVSLGQGLSQLFGNLQSSQRDHYLAYLKAHGALRQGLSDALAAFAKWQLPFFVVSNGLDFMVQPLLENLVEPSHVYCNRADFSQPPIRIRKPWPCDDACQGDCGLCKPRLVRLLAHRYQAPVIFIGDGRSDFLGAEAAHLVFARASLARHLNDSRQAYFPFENFTQIRDMISHWLDAPPMEPNRNNADFRQTFD